MSARTNRFDSCTLRQGKIMSNQDVQFLQLAIAKSQESVDAGGFPVGVLLTKNNEIISSGISNGKQLHDPISHAEIVAIREACEKLQTRILKDCVLYSSLEPCLMCYAAATWARIPRIVFACRKNQVSAQHSEGTHNLAKINQLTNHPITLIHLQELEKSALNVIQNWEKKIT